MKYPFAAARIPRLLCRPAFQVLAVTVLGFLIAFVLAIISDHSYISWMRLAVTSPVSIVDLLLGSCLPLLLTAAAVYFARTRLLLLLLFLKSCSFCLCAIACAAAFGRAGWLITPLLLFTDIVVLPVQCWFSARHAKGSTAGLKADFAVCICIAAAAAVMDAYMVSPFLAGIFH